MSRRSEIRLSPSTRASVCRGKREQDHGLTESERSDIGSCEGLGIRMSAGCGVRLKWGVGGLQGGVLDSKAAGQGTA